MTGYLQRRYDFDTREMASAYDEAFYWSSRFGTILLDNVPLRSNANILDLACGTGFPTFELAHICGPSCRVTGVDIWTEALDRARSKLAFYELP
ncbi:MAG: class I SAM-dependent methyltransferase, partial [Chloroflexia bacterium]